MSHGVIVFAVTNESQSTCTVRGYPQVSFYGGADTKQPSSGQLIVRNPHTIAIALSRGDVWQCPDSGSKPVTLAPGASAYFALGTATAYDGPEVDVTIVRLTLPGATDARTLRPSLYANGPLGQPMPVDITALRARPWTWMP